MKIQKLPVSVILAINGPKTAPADTAIPSFVISEGNRNSTLFRICCALRRQNIPESFILRIARFINIKAMERPLEKQEVKAIVRSAHRYDAEAGERFGCMSEVESAEVDWLWYPYFPRGCIVIIDGHPGQGKSYFTLFLTALLSRGGQLPFSDRVVKKMRVLILNAEDDPSRTLRPRLEKLNANFSAGGIRYQKKFIPLNAEGFEIIEAEFFDFKPDVVIIDPLLTYMGSEVDMHRFNEATSFMSDLDDLARQYNACIIGIRHLTKANNDHGMMRGQGSMGFAARARSMMLVGNDPDDKKTKAIVHVKSNYSELGQTLLFKLTGGSEKECPQFEWVGTAEYGADALDKPNPVGRPSNQVNLQQFLLDALEGGPCKLLALMRMASARGMDVSKNTMLRALREVATEKGAGPATVWALKKIAP